MVVMYNVNFLIFIIVLWLCKRMFLFVNIKYTGKHSGVIGHQGSNLLFFEV